MGINPARIPTPQYTLPTLPLKRLSSTSGSGGNPRIYVHKIRLVSGWMCSYLTQLSIADHGNPLSHFILHTKPRIFPNPFAMCRQHTNTNTSQNRNITVLQHSPACDTKCKNRRHKKTYALYTIQIHKPAPPALAHPPTTQIFQLILQS